MPHTLALTIGDPTGIGPEITAKTLQQLTRFPDTKFVVLGAISALRQTAQQLGLTLPEADQVTYHQIDAISVGALAYQSLAQAVAMIAGDQADALVTGPIAKSNLAAAGLPYPGHTEILEELAQKFYPGSAAKSEMLFLYRQFRLLLLTRHLPLRDVPAALAQQGAVARPLKTLIQFLRQQGISEPKIALLGVNPHAGEIGGEEEDKLFKPVIKAVNAIGASQLAGPFAADGFFRGFSADAPGYDAVVAAYHDQGLIPFKLLAGYDAVNVTIGLPFLRTSVSHGTADSIVGQDKAMADSLLAAIQTALDLLASNNR
jgi:4-hydroxythreonine-4-phosphate dehydrogenase